MTILAGGSGSFGSITYSTLQTKVGDWVNRGDLTSQIPDFIYFGEDYIYRDLRIRAMETALSGTIASGVVALPSDYIDLKNAYISSTDPYQPLERKSAQWVYRQYPTRAADGRPKYIAREGSNFIFGPYPDSGYTVAGIYYARLSHLSASNTTNWFTTNAPELLLYAALMATEPYLKNDERFPFWQTRYYELIAAVQKEDDNEHTSGEESPAATVYGVTPA